MVNIAMFLRRISPAYFLAIILILKANTHPKLNPKPASRLSPTLPAAVILRGTLILKVGTCSKSKASFPNVAEPIYNITAVFLYYTRSLPVP